MNFSEDQSSGDLISHPQSCARSRLYSRHCHSIVRRHDASAFSRWSPYQLRHYRLSGQSILSPSNVIIRHVDFTHVIRLILEMLRALQYFKANRSPNRRLCRVRAAKSPSLPAQSISSHTIHHLAIGHAVTSLRSRQDYLMTANSQSQPSGLI